MKRGILTLVICCLSLLVGGCLAPIPRQEISLNNQVPVKKLTVKKYDFDNSLIDKKSFLDQISSQLMNSGKFNAVKKVSKYNPNISYSRFDFSVSGVYVEYDVDSFNIRFVNGSMNERHQYYSATVGKYLTINEAWSLAVTKAEIPYVLKEEGDNYVLEFTYPDKIVEEERGGSSKLLAPANEIQADLLTKFTSLHNPSISFTKIISGEADSKYDSASIYGNFERMLGKYNPKKDDVTADDIEKKNVYKLKHNNVEMMTEIAVYPYRNGSKVNYVVHVPYIVSDTISIANEDIEQIKGIIGKVIVD